MDALTRRYPVLFQKFENFSLLIKEKQNDVMSEKGTRLVVDELTKPKNPGSIAVQLPGPLILSSCSRARRTGTGRHTDSQTN